MKKKWIIFITVWMIFLAVGETCFADVIWEPDNDFYSAHRDDADYIGRNYYVNGEKGNAIVYEEPDSSRGFARIANGVEFNVSFTYSKRKTKWGLVEFTIDENGEVRNTYGEDSLTGWIDMNDLLLVYDCIKFNQEHIGEFYDFTGDYDNVIVAGENTAIWTYPGSGVTTGGLLDPRDLVFQMAYDDEDRRQWGYIGYHYGLRDVWICISDPENVNIPAFGVKEPELIPADPVKSGLITESEENSEPEIWIIYILVGAVVAATAILIPLLMKKKRSRHV